MTECLNDIERFYYGKGLVLPVPAELIWCRELKQKDLIEMSAERGKFICQSQSLNLFIENVNSAKLTAAHFHSWQLGLKTGMYYLRTKSAVDALAGLGIDAEKLKKLRE